MITRPFVFVRNECSTRMLNSGQSDALFVCETQRWTESRELFPGVILRSFLDDREHPCQQYSASPYRGTNDRGVHRYVRRICEAPYSPLGLDRDLFCTSIDARTRCHQRPCSDQTVRTHFLSRNRSTTNTSRFCRLGPKNVPEEDVTCNHEPDSSNSSSKIVRPFRGQLLTSIARTYFRNARTYIAWSWSSIWSISWEYAWIR